MNRRLFFSLFFVGWTTGASAQDAQISGAEVAATCLSCHTLEQGGEEKWGPNLFDIVGRPVGSVEGYRYAPYLDAQAEQGAVWTEESLRSWLIDSKAVAKAANARTKMPPQRLDDEELDALITYLKTMVQP